jgi:hypothetical protein
VNTLKVMIALFVAALIYDGLLCHLHDMRHPYQGEIVFVDGASDDLPDGLGLPLTAEDPVANIQADRAAMANAAADCLIAHRIPEYDPDSGLFLFCYQAEAVTVGKAGTTYRDTP